MSELSFCLLKDYNFEGLLWLNFLLLANNFQQIKKIKLIGPLKIKLGKLFLRLIEQFAKYQIELSNSKLLIN